MAEAYPAPAPQPDADSDDAGMVIDTPTSEKKATRTALIPNEFFGDKELKPGTECTIRIERVLDGQVSVAYVEHEDEEVGLGEEPEVGDPEMDQYMNG